MLKKLVFFILLLSFNLHANLIKQIRKLSKTDMQELIMQLNLVYETSFHNSFHGDKPTIWPLPFSHALQLVFYLHGQASKQAIRDVPSWIPGVFILRRGVHAALLRKKIKEIQAIYNSKFLERP